MKESEPLATVSNGRTTSGRFGRGNTFGKGNPNLRRIHLLRNKLLKAVDGDAMAQIGYKLVEMAKSGDLDAMRVLFSFTIGKPPRSIEVTPSYPRDPLTSGSEGELEARIKRVDARLAEWDKLQSAKLEDLYRRVQDGPPRGNEKLSP
jgi:hypothetical protein